MRTSTTSLRHPRGQTIVLSALMMLIVAVTLFITLNVSRAIHEKIRVQNAADSQAYSMAVEEARAFNYFAYTNRAIAGAFVAMSLLHAYHSELTTAADSYWSAAIAFFEIAGEEFALCCACPFCCNVTHCIHGVEDIITAIDFISNSSDVEDAVQALDPPFRNAMKAWLAMVLLIELSQDAMELGVAKDVGISGRAALDDATGGPLNGKPLNVPAGSDKAPMGIGGANAALFAKAIYNKADDHRPKTMGDIANASRLSWEDGHNNILVSNAMLSLLLWQRLPGESSHSDFFFSVMNSGADSMVKDTDDAVESAGTAVNAVGSHDWWLLTVLDCEHECMVGVAPVSLSPPTKIVTNDNNGEHDGWAIGNGCDGQPHQSMIAMDDFETLLGQSKRLLGFREFDPGTKGKAPWNQPAVYGYAEQDLRLNEQGKHAPWEIMNNGDINFGLIGQARMRVADQNFGAGISKALVYYHRPRDWQEGPSFFNPYWRAKLHPFGEMEAPAVLGLALTGTNASDAVTGAAAVEALFHINTSKGDLAMQP
jgi:hypothetical protein